MAADPAHDEPANDDPDDPARARACVMMVTLLGAWDADGLTPVALAAHLRAALAPTHGLATAIIDLERTLPRWRELEVYTEQLVAELRRPT